MHRMRIKRATRAGEKAGEDKARPRTSCSRAFRSWSSGLGNTGPTEWSSTNPSVIMVYALAGSSHERETSLSLSLSLSLFLSLSAFATSRSIALPTAITTALLAPTRLPARFQTHYTIFNTLRTAALSGASVLCPRVTQTALWASPSVTESKLPTLWTRRKSCKQRRAPVHPLLLCARRNEFRNQRSIGLFYNAANTAGRGREGKTNHHHHHRHHCSDFQENSSQTNG